MQLMMYQIVVSIWNIPASTEKRYMLLSTVNTLREDYNIEKSLLVSSIISAYCGLKTSSSSSRLARSANNGQNRPGACSESCASYQSIIPASEIPHYH